MRGSLFVSARDLVVNRYGRQVWDEVAANAGIRGRVLMPLDDIEDKLFVGMVNSLAKVANRPKEDVWQDLADHWIGEHTRRTTPFYYAAASSAKDFLMQMDKVHATVTKASAGSAKKPEFTFREEPDGTLIIRYGSERGLHDYFVALVRAVAKHYGEDAVIRGIGDEARVRFSARA
jgi:hypothetical protein